MSPRKAGRIPIVPAEAAAGMANLLHIARAIDETMNAKTKVPKLSLIYEKHDVDRKSRRFHQEATATGNPLAQYTLREQRTLVTQLYNLVQAPMSLCLDAVIEIRGVNPFVGVSSSQANTLKPGWRKPLPVLVRINGDSATAWRTNLMPDGSGNFYLYLHASMRKASGTKVGDRVRVEIEFDAAYRNGPQHPMPKWFRQALDGNPQAKRNWTALIPSRKKEILRYLSKLVSVDARIRNQA